MESSPKAPEPQPDGNHRPVPVEMQSGWLVLVVAACKACSYSQGKVVMWPCPAVQVEPISATELDDELRELLGNKE